LACTLLSPSPVAGVLQALLIAIWLEWRETHPKDFQRTKDDIIEKAADTPSDPEPTPTLLS
jgi:hypothetical protein